MGASILPVATTDNIPSVATGNKNPLGEIYRVGDKTYELVAVAEASGVVKRRALTRAAISDTTVEYVDAVTDVICGFTPDDLLGTAALASGIVMQVDGPITLGVTSETLADLAALYWNKTTNKATGTAGSDAMYIGRNSGAVTSGLTTLTCQLDLVPDWFITVA